MQNKKSIGIVGAGIAGLSTAIRLAVAGYEVEVFEKNDYTGGKMTMIEGGGYRFDAGPSLFTLPHLVDDLFRLAGKTPTDYFSYRAHHSVCNYFWLDGTRMTMYADQAKNAQVITETFGVEAGDAVANYLAAAQKKYDLTAPFFLEGSLHRAKTFVDRRVFGVLAAIPSLGLFNTLDEENKRYFQEPKLVQLFNRYATYNGSSPYQTPGIMQMITHLEHGLGSYLPYGGMHEIGQSLTRLAKDLGVQFRLNSPVEHIESERGTIKGLVSKGVFYAFDAVVCNSDVKHAYSHLLGKDIKRPEKTLQQAPSSSALIFYWGVKQEFPELDMHNILFSQDYKQEFERIANNGPFWEDPTVYINITSKLESSDAPAGGENWFVMINVPHDSGQDWDTIIKKARKSIIERINAVLGCDLDELIEFEDVLEPRLIERRTSSVGGALYGTSSNDRMAAFLRHPNRHLRAKGLYLCGGSAHPGGGVPLCLLSGKIASEWLIEDFQ